jgi:hypothetical protein
MLKRFEEKKLIEYQENENGCDAVKMIGYNFLNDPEFYYAYKTKKETEWTGRILSTIGLAEITQYISLGYEFREKEIVNDFPN